MEKQSAHIQRRKKALVETIEFTEIGSDGDDVPIVQTIQTQQDLEKDDVPTEETIQTQQDSHEDDVPISTTL